MAADAVSDDLDYEIWARTAKSTLMEKGLWDVVENGVPLDPSKVPELAATINVVDLAQWRNCVIKDMKALKIMQSSLPDSAFRKTLSVASAKELWDFLEKGNQQANLLRLEKQFEQLSMGERESVVSYLNRVKQVVEQLRRLKNEKSDYEVIKKALASLSGSYDGVAPLLEELMDLKDMTFDSLVEFFHVYDSITEDDIHLMLKLNRLKYESGKNNHNQQDCYSNLKASGAREATPQAARYRKIKNQQQQVATEAEEEEILVDYILMAKLALADFTYDEDMWMIYGHATNHMTPYEKLFTNLDRTKKAKVGLVDGTVIMAEGLGDVKITMKGGKKKTINNVLFVPHGINRNVLSITQMTSRGCSLNSGERGECIVQDRTGAVFGDTLWDERGLSIRLQVISPLK